MQRNGFVVVCGDLELGGGGEGADKIEEAIDNWFMFELCECRTECYEELLGQNRFVLSAQGLELSNALFVRSRRTLRSFQDIGQ
jgi:hypothetical protein